MSKAGGRKLLCAVDDISDGGAKSFWFGAGSERHGVFVIRQGAAIVGYVNSCPHAGTPLNFLGDRFLDRTGRSLLCATHGALFRIEDGFCVRGPCAGEALTLVSTIIIDNHIYLVR